MENYLTATIINEPNPKAWFIEDSTKITEADVDNFILSYDVSRNGNHTVVNATLANGMQIIETSACVDEINYDQELGTKLALEKIKSRVWFGLGFVLAWAKKPSLCLNYVE